MATKPNPFESKADLIEPCFRAYVRTGSITQAAEAVGIARKTVYDWLKRHTDKYDKILREEMTNAAAGAFTIIQDLAKNSPNQQVRLQAAKDILNRAGYAPVERKELAISGLKEEELESELKKLLGISEVAGEALH